MMPWQLEKHLLYPLYLLSERKTRVWEALLHNVSQLLWVDVDRRLGRRLFSSKLVAKPENLAYTAEDVEMPTAMMLQDMS